MIELFLALSLTPLASVLLERQGETWMVTVPVPCFAVALESAPAPDGPWTEERQSWAACPQVHSFAVTNRLPQVFFRARLLDNGLVPTPYGVTALAQGNVVTVSSALLFRCDDSQVGPLHVYRRATDGPALWVGTTGNASVFFEDRPQPGRWRYQMQAEDVGFLSFPSAESNEVTVE